VWRGILNKFHRPESHLLLVSFHEFHSQGSNNSDQSSGYLSGGGGSTSLPTNATAADTQNPFDFKYGQARLDGMSDKFQQGQQPKNDHQSMKNHSMTSSLTEYSSLSTHEQDMEFNNRHK
jgi:hypothetical protein